MTVESVNHVLNLNGWINFIRKKAFLKALDTLASIFIAVAPLSLFPAGLEHELVYLNFGGVNINESS